MCQGGKPSVEIMLAILEIILVLTLSYPNKGDFTAGNGTGGEGIWGEKWKDENFQLKHTE